jgi:hypothetical protein
MSDQTSSGARSRRRAMTGAMLGLTTLSALAVTGCGGPRSSSGLQGTQRQQACTAVADVLSDGPDPTADPVGYAEAQVLPLRQLHISQPAVRSAVDQLAAAYQAYSVSKGVDTAADAKKVAADEEALNALCPGAAP